MLPYMEKQHETEVSGVFLSRGGKSYLLHEAKRGTVVAFSLLISSRSRSPHVRHRRGTNEGSRGSCRVHLDCYTHWWRNTPLVCRAAPNYTLSSLVQPKVRNQGAPNTADWRWWGRSLDEFGLALLHEVTQHTFGEMMWNCCEIVSMVSAKPHLLTTMIQIIYFCNVLPVLKVNLHDRFCSTTLHGKARLTTWVWEMYSPHLPIPRGGGELTSRPRCGLTLPPHPPFDAERQAGRDRIPFLETRISKPQAKHEQAELSVHFKERLQQQDKRLKKAWKAKFLIKKKCSRV